MKRQAEEIDITGDIETPVKRQCNKTTQLSVFKNDRKLYQTQMDAVCKMMELERRPLEMEVYKGEGKYVSAQMRACWHRGFLAAGVGFGKTCTAMEFLLQCAINNTTSRHETSIVAVPLNLYTQWRTEITMLRSSELMFKFVDSPRTITPTCNRDRVYVVKESIFGDFIDQNKEFIFDRLMVDEADAIKIPWRNIATRLHAKFLWYISASVDITNMGSLFLGRRVARAICMPGNERPLVLGQQQVTDWKVTRQDFEFNANKKSVINKLADQECIEFYYALGSEESLEALTVRIKAKWAKKIETAAELDRKDIANGRNPGRHDMLGRTSEEIEKKNADYAIHALEKAIKVNAHIDNTLRKALIKVFMTIPRGTKVLLIGSNPRRNIGQLCIKGWRISQLTGQEKFISKQIEHYNLPPEDKNAIDVLMLDSGSSKVTGMNLQNTSVIIFADDKISPAMKKQAEGRALRTGRDPAFPLTIYNAVQAQEKYTASQAQEKEVPTFDVLRKAGVVGVSGAGTARAVQQWLADDDETDEDVINIYGAQFKLF